jgi:hypothetical protein
MIELPFDYSRCPGGDCPSKDQCARYTSKHRDFWQSITEFNKLFYIDGKCDYFIDNEKTTER